MGIGTVVYLGVMIFVSIFSLFYVEYSAYQLMMLAFILPIAMLIVLIILYRNVEIEVGTKSPVAEKRNFKSTGNIYMEVKIENSTRFLPLSRGVVYIKYVNQYTGEKGKMKVNFCADASGKTVKKVKIPISNCGNVKVEVQKAKICDYLSIFAKKLHFEFTKENILVYMPARPVIINDKWLVREGDGEVTHYSPYKKGEDPSEVFEIRDFKEGDKLQRIHWKLSSKKQSLMVKEYSMPLINASHIFVDKYVAGSGRQKQRAMNRLVQGVYSVANALLAKDIPQEYIWFDQEANLIRRERVSREDEILWVMQELFSCPATDKPDALVEAYSGWHHGQPQMTALYLTVASGQDVDSRMLQVQNLKIVDLNHGGEEDPYEI